MIELEDCENFTEKDALKMDEFAQMSKITTYADWFRDYKADGGRWDFFRWIEEIGYLYRLENI